MSKSRVKRSYDSFYGDGESVQMLTSSPHCSPLRAVQPLQTLEEQQAAAHQQQQAFTLNASNMSDASQLPSSDVSSSTGFSFGFSPTPTPNFSSLYSNSTTNPFANLATASPAQIRQPTFSSPSSSSSSSVALPNPSYASPPASSYKRFRRPGQTDVSMSDEQESSSSSTTTGDADSTAHQSPFARLKRPALDELMFVPRHFKKQAIAAALSGPSSTAHARPIAASPNSPSTNSTVAACIPPPPSSTGSSLPSYHNQLFTYEQVASIVRNALDMREEQIREEYNRTLQELLREQFENFSMFNRDYISRNMKQLDTNDDHENSYYS